MTASTSAPATPRLAPLALPDRGVARYEGFVRHRRVGETPHAFQQRVSYLLLDLDRLPGSFDDLPLWSARRPAPVRFRSRDHLAGDDRPLAGQVRRLVADRTGTEAAGPVWLLTQPRRAGWLFNPMSAYYCLSPSLDRVEALVLEVTNTPWHERCWYVIEVRADRPTGPWDVAKTMHVSPFLPPDLTYRIRSTAPAERLTVRLEARRGDDPMLAADLVLRQAELDAGRAFASAVRDALATARVSAGIYLHAARLWSKGAPVHRHPGAHPRPDEAGTR